MKCYHILECDKQQEITDSLYGFYDEIISNREVKDFWNRLSRQEIIRYLLTENNPTVSWFKQLGLRVRDMSFTVYDHKIVTGIHKDQPPVIAKINFPVVNTRNTYNVWYDDDLNEIDRVECDKPIVFRSDIPHTVEIGPEAKYPRVQFSFCFYDEPLQLLK